MTLEQIIEDGATALENFLAHYAAEIAYLEKHASGQYVEINSIIDTKRMKYGAK